MTVPFGFSRPMAVVTVGTFVHRRRRRLGRADDVVGELRKPGGGGGRRRLITVGGLGEFRRRGGIVIHSDQDRRRLEQLHLLMLGDEQFGGVRPFRRMLPPVAVSIKPCLPPTGSPFHRPRAWPPRESTGGVDGIPSTAGVH